MTMFIRFCAAIDITGAAEPGDGPGFEGFRFDFFAVALVRIAIPERWRVRPLGSLTLTLSLSRFVPDLRAPCHGRGRKSLRGLVNQS